MTAGSGGAADTGGQTGTGGAATGGRGGAGEAGHGGNGQAGGNGTGSGGSPVDGGIADVVVHDGPTMNGGAYVRTGWTATYTCTGTCPNTMSQDTQDKDTTRAFDGNMSTRWSTGQYQQSAVLMPVFPLFFTVDMKEVKVVSKMTFYAGGDPYDAPGQMDVLLSLDGTTYTTVLPGYLPTAPSKGGTETVMLPQATPARFIQLKATKTIKQVNAQLGDRYWAIGEMNVYP